MRKVLRLPKPGFRNEFFLFLLPLFFVFHGYNEYYGKITVPDGLLLLLEYEALMSVVVLFFFLLFRSFRKAALYTIILFSFHFFFGAGHDWLKETVPGTVLIKYSFILPLVFLFFILLFLSLKKAAWSFNPEVKYLNLIFLCLIVVEGVTIFFKQLPYQGIVRQATSDNQIASLLKPCDTCANEDIHLIVLDEYAGAEQLKEVFHFDNSPFTDTLRARGFRVIEGARSNYNYSPISMASLFSMDYLAGLGKWPHYVLDDIGNPIIKENVFVDFLIRQGYEINNISIFDLKQLPAYKNEFKPGVQVLTNHTFLSRIQKDVSYHLIATLKWEKATKRMVRSLERGVVHNINTIDTVLKRVGRKRFSRPQFYYTHLMMPHGPYVLDRNGRSVGLDYYLDTDRDRGTKRGYIEYLQYSNKKVKSFIDSLIKASAAPPVIILMSDHGFRHPSVEEKYHFMTLNAIYFPDRQYKGFYDSISNVNQMRVLLNNRFGQKLSLLKDSSIFLGWPGM
jgi:hypothetical protein